MKLNKKLTLLALAFLAANAAFYLHATTLNGGASMIYVFIFPAFWTLTFATSLVLCVINRKSWFRRNIIYSTIIALFFCTPLPLSLFAMLVRPASRLVSSGSNGNAGTSFENWEFNNGKTEVIKYWKDGEKNGTWVYFNKKGDTLKKEIYKDGKLMARKSY